MRELVQKQNQHNHFTNTNTGKDESKLRKEIHPILRLQKIIGNQAVQRLLLSNSGQDRCSMQAAPTTPGLLEI